MEAKTVAKLLVEEVIVRFGTSYVIHTDQGIQFESILFQEMCRLLQIQKTRTTPYHPQSDGMVERNNRTILTMLSAFVNEHQNDWDEHLPYIAMAYRAAEHETTGNTPNYMMLGREVTTRWIFNIACHVAWHISLKIVGHGYPRTEWKKLINMSGKMLKVPCTDRRNIMTRNYPGKVFSQSIKYLFSFQMLNQG